MLKTVLLTIETTVLALMSAEYFGKYNLLDFLKDKVIVLSRNRLGDTGALVIVFALFALVIFLTARF